jgi:hypothetical protein
MRKQKSETKKSENVLAFYEKYGNIEVDVIFFSPAACTKASSFYLI